MLVKVEYLNPGGSSKDRIADPDHRRRRARRAAASPAARSSSRPRGNTGVGLALVAQQRGYRCVFVLPDKVGEDKRNVLTAYGAEIVVTPTSVAPEAPESYYRVSDRLAREIPGAFKPNQYANPNGPLQPLRDHRPRDLARHRRASSRTSSPASAPAAPSAAPAGTSRRSPTAACTIVGADPEGSVYSGGTGRPYLVEGVGEDFWPTRLRPDRRRRDHRRLRRRVVRDDPPPRPRGGAARRRLERHGRRRRAAGRRATCPRTTSSSCCCPTAAAATSARSSTTSGCAPTASRRSRARRTVRDLLGAEERRAARPRARAPDRHRARRDRDHDRVRRLAAAGAERRAARRDGRGRRRGRRAGAARARLHRRARR